MKQTITPLKQEPFNLTNQLWSIRNYMNKHGVTDSGLQNIIMGSFLGQTGQSELPFKEGIKYIKSHFGLFYQYANNSKVQLDNLKKSL